MLDFLAYSIIALAVTLAVGMMVYRWKHPKVCNEQCEGCELVNRCSKNDN